MSIFTPDTLYDLLPAVYRLRDADEGKPLRALVAVLAEQAGIVEADIDRLYDNLFIETCEEWVVPYIGDLLGVRNLHVFDADAFSQRAHVANTLRFRRRKGTATMLEQLAFDTTGWRARAVEFFDVLATTQYLNHLRPHNLRTPDLRATAALDLIGTAFDTAAHTADVRRIASGGIRHNIPNVGLFLWRLQSYAVPRRQARDLGDGRFTVHPIGVDAPLFNRPQTEVEITHLAEEINVPAPLRRRPLYDELEARRQALAEGRTPTFAYFDDRADAAHPPVFQLFVDEARDGDAWLPVSADEVMVCDLSDWNEAGWTRPAASKTYHVPQPDGTTAPVSMPIRAVVDPVLGRVAFPASETPGVVHVSYAYGFSADLGGGPYNRRASLDADLLGAAGWQVGVGRAATLAALGVAADGTQFFETLTDAVVAWNGQTESDTGVIAVLDNASYEETLAGPARIELDEGRRLLVVAADWPGLTEAGAVEPDERVAHVRGDLSVVGTADAASDAPGELTISGLLVERNVTVEPGHLGLLALDHVSVGTVTVDADAAGPNTELRLRLDRTISGPVVAPESIREVCVTDSILLAEFDGGVRGFVLAGAADGSTVGPPATVERSTLIGGVRVVELTLASEAIFTESVDVERLQRGCVRFSFVPPSSRTPRRFRCQPDLAFATRADELDVESGLLPAAERRRIRLRVVPGFTSTRRADPGFAQLGPSCPDEIRTGSEDGSEMGAYALLKQPQREANLRATLDEYLRFGLDAGLIFAT